MDGDQVDPGKRLRELMRRPGIVSSMGAHDVFSALIMEQAGLEMVFAGGFGSSASMLGLPDLNFLTMTEMADAVRRLASRLSIPVVADGDTGHGDCLQVRRTVRMFEAAGAAGIILEDQTMPKKCGHFGAKLVVSRQGMQDRIKAALDARRSDDFVVFARTDAREVHGLEEAIERVNACAALGADVGFVEAPRSLAELEEIPRRVNCPAFANMLTGGVTPVVPVPDLERMGYKFAVAPVESLMVCGRVLQKLCRQWRREGSVEGFEEALTFTELKDVLGVRDLLSQREEESARDRERARENEGAAPE